LPETIVKVHSLADSKSQPDEIAGVYVRCGYMYVTFCG